MSLYPAPLDSLDTYTTFDPTDLALLAGQPEGMLPSTSALQHLLAAINRQEGVPGYAESHLTDLSALLQQYGSLGAALYHFGPGGSGCVNAQGQAVGWCYVQQVLGFAGLTGNETASDLGLPAGASGASANCQTSILGATFTDPVCAFRNWMQDAGIRLLVIAIAIIIGLVALNALLGGPAQIVLKTATQTAAEAV
jgi:hypothetical protein